MSSSGSGHSASDIITYIGIPLAVAGILPILYNFFVTLVTLYKVKGILQRSELSATAIRSDVFNRTIELDLPRYKIATHDRKDTRYWEPRQRPSTISGGSWTTLEWRRIRVGTKLHRIQYADEVKQPQAEIEFDQLISYLLDLGATPDLKGWAVLRSNGVWTPKDHCLLYSPDGRDHALTVASLDDSDGHLSLKLHWSTTWKTRESGALPPRWVRLASIRPPVSDKETILKAPVTQDALEALGTPDVPLQTGIAFPKEDTEVSEKQGDFCTTDTDCELSNDGLLQVAGLEASSHNSHNIDHLRIGRGNSDGVWFASALAAYASVSHTISWYTIPDEILKFANKETVPCGVLNLLEILEDSEAPVWATKSDDATAGASEFLRTRDEQRLALQAEARMPWEQRQDAAHDRHRRERQQWERDGEYPPLSGCEKGTYLVFAASERLRKEQKDLDTRMQQAFQSTCWDNALVAQHSLRWLESRMPSRVAGSSNLEIVVGTILHRMVLDVEFSASICEVLKLWKAWSDSGGMKESDFVALKAATESFAQAALLAALIRATALAHKGSLSADLHKCIEAFKTVRLG